jgi:hypothetical protein
LFGATLGGIKYLIAVLAGGDTISAAITTAFASAHGALSGQTSLRAYLGGWGIAAVLLVSAGVIALKREVSGTESAIKFVLDVVGNQPLSQLSDWRFLIQNYAQEDRNLIAIKSAHLILGEVLPCEFS